MYWKYAVRRVIYAFIMFAVIVFIFSAIFNSVADRTMRAQIRETVSGESIARARMTSHQNPDELLIWKAARTAELTRMYHLDEPLMSRIFWRTIETVTFRLGQSTLIRS
ncbi:MAG: ABC transporter permease, partial [Candidatus Bipolaricaulis sp.]|nr:ABC transporter permease [Candidatus Bipolaricaulis sp.]